MGLNKNSFFVILITIILLCIVPTAFSDSKPLIWNGTYNYEEAQQVFNIIFNPIEKDGRLESVDIVSNHSIEKGSINTSVSEKNSKTTILKSPKVMGHSMGLVFVSFNRRISNDEIELALSYPKDLSSGKNEWGSLIVRFKKTKNGVVATNESGKEIETIATQKIKSGPVQISFLPEFTAPTGMIVSVH